MYFHDCTDSVSGSFPLVYEIVIIALVITNSIVITVRQLHSLKFTSSITVACVATCAHAYRIHKLIAITIIIVIIIATKTRTENFIVPLLHAICPYVYGSNVAPTTSSQLKSSLSSLSPFLQLLASNDKNRQIQFLLTCTISVALVTRIV